MKTSELIYREKSLKALSTQNIEYFNVKPGGKYISHASIKG
jgi:hypothetical protein